VLLINKEKKERLDQLQPWCAARGRKVITYQTRRKTRALPIAHGTRRRGDIRAPWAPDIPRKLKTMQYTEYATHPVSSRRKYGVLSESCTSGLCRDAAALLPLAAAKKKKKKKERLRPFGLLADPRYLSVPGV
jgi:hypothetical protein